MEINAIGCRELSGFLGFPIGNPYVIVNVGGEEKASTQKSNKPNGSNANFLEVLNLKVAIPENPLFAPPINLLVYDDRVIHKPLIAFRSLSTAHFIPWENVQVVQEDAPVVVKEIPGAPLEERKPAEEGVGLESTLKVNVPLQDPTQVDLDALNLTPQEREEREKMNERMKKLNGKSF